MGGGRLTRWMTRSVRRAVAAFILARMSDGEMGRWLRTFVRRGVFVLRGLRGRADWAMPRLSQ
jgi:hypothetical protein